MAVLVDSREESVGKWKTKLESLLPRGVEVKVALNLPADFAIVYGEGGEPSRVVFVERKTPNDLWSSILDRRLWSQLDAMCAPNVVARFVVVDGPLSGFFRMMFSRYRKAIGAKAAREKVKRMRKAVLGAVASVMLDSVRRDRPPAFVVEVPRGSVPEFVSLLAGRLAEKPPPTVPVAVKTETWADVQEWMLACVPGVGIKRARELLKAFGSVLNVLTAPPEKLTKVKGVGPATAENIRKAANMPYAEAKKTARPGRMP